MKGIKLLALIMAITSFPVKASTDNTVFKEEYCFSNNLILSWNQLIKDLKDKDIYTQLKEVNYFFNRNITHIDDIDNWGEEDFWATPFETMVQGAGDCEDYSTAKYKTLKLLNVSPEKLKLHYVRATIGRSNQTVAHMVLTYTDDNYDHLVLDNLVPSLTPLEQRIDLIPVFAFNKNTLWIGDQVFDNPQDRIENWNGFMKRYSIQKNSCLFPENG